MLDDGQFVASIDRGNALGLVAGQPAQLKHQYAVQISHSYEVHNIVLAGMGGSALAGEFVRNWLSDKLKVPFVIVRDYALPLFVGQNSLVFISSHSGNTEETLSAFQDAKTKQAQVVILTAGGKLGQIAQQTNLPLFQIPAGGQPRLSMYYAVKAIVSAIEQKGLVTGAVQELEKVSEWAEQIVATWIQTVPSHQNAAKQIAEKLFGNTGVIYGGPTLAAAAQKWKVSLNENAKNVAFYNLMSEFNHNEFQGWLNPQDKPFKVIELKSSLDHPQIAKRWDISNRLLSGKMPSPIEVMAEGKSKLEQLLWAQMLGDFVGVYLGILNKVDPASVDLIESLKKELL